MVMTRTPLRIPFAGGLTDIKGYADRFGGLTISATVDKYIYVAVKRGLEPGFELRYLNAYERAERVDDIRHDHIREAIKLVGLAGSSLDISVMSDLRHEGGLGSSGAFTAALLSALHEHKGEKLSPEAIIAEASRLEMDILEGASGYHDHTIAHLGGLKMIEYRDRLPRELPLELEPGLVERLFRRLSVFYSGYHAKTKPSLVLLSAGLEGALGILDAIKENAFALRAALLRGDLDACGDCLQRQQDLKQELPGSFVNDFVLETMRRVRSLGARAQIPGGKVGAFLVVYRPLGMKRKEVLKRFSDLRYLPMRFEPSGTASARL